MRIILSGPLSIFDELESLVYLGFTHYLVSVGTPEHPENINAIDFIFHNKPNARLLLYLRKIAECYFVPLKDPRFHEVSMKFCLYQKPC